MSCCNAAVAVATQLGSDAAVCMTRQSIDTFWLGVLPPANSPTHPTPSNPAGEEPWRSLPHFRYHVHDELDNSAAAVARIRAAQKASCVCVLLSFLTVHGCLLYGWQLRGVVLDAQHRPRPAAAATPISSSLATSLFWLCPASSDLQQAPHPGDWWRLAPVWPCAAGGSNRHAFRQFKTGFRRAPAALVSFNHGTPHLHCRRRWMRRSVCRSASPS